jgi:hypothetical protein
MRRALLLLLTVSILFPFSIGTDTLPGVKVSFRIDKSLWRNELGNDAAWVDSEGRAGMIRILKQIFGFLDFRDSGDSYGLTISLKDRESAGLPSSELKETVFELTLSSPNISAPVPPVAGTFRSVADCLLPRGDKDIFLNEILSAFERYIRANQENIVERLLAKICITDRAYQVENAHYWILPLKCQDIAACDDPADGASEFHIITEIKVAGGSSLKNFYAILCGKTALKSDEIPEDYWGEKIIAETYDPANPSVQSIGNQNIRVFMKKYIPGVASPAASKTTSPDQFRATGK